MPDPIMKLRSLRIESFKTFDQAEFHFNPDINIFTGVNNSGKTTVLEAISLWAECFRKLIRRAGRSDKALKIRQGAYRLGNKHQNYFEHRSITSVRCPNFEDMFHNMESGPGAKVVLDAAVVDDNSDTLRVPFTIWRASGENYDIVLSGHDKFDFAKFNQFFRRLPEPINIVYASPVAVLQSEEEFVTGPRLRERILGRSSMLVLRNRLHRMSHGMSTNYNELLDTLSYVLTERRPAIGLRAEGNPVRDVYVRALAQMSPKDVEKEICLLGSGTLQIIEILLGIFEEKDSEDSLNLILLDEPDSHIHRDIQRRLMETLARHADKVQFFLTTHSESLIRSARPEHLFHLEPDTTKVYHPIVHGRMPGQKKGLQPSRQIKILRSLGSETSLDLLNALEADFLVLVEGEDDARYIQQIAEKAKIPPAPFRAMYWSFQGIDSIMRHIEAYKSIFSAIRNKASLWEKAALVMDRDHLTDAKRQDQLAVFRDRLGLKRTYIWESYAIEAVVLSDREKFKRLIADRLRQDGVAVDEPKLDATIDAGLESLQSRYLQKLDSVDFQQGLYHRLKERQKQLVTLSGKKNWPHWPDGQLQPEYVQYAKTLLQQGQVHQLADKDDVRALVEGAYALFGAPPPGDDWFDRLLQAASLSTWFDQWSELMQALR